MREYARFSATFWQRGTGKALRGHPYSQVAAMYLIAPPNGTMCGIFNTDPVIIAHDTGIKEPDVNRALSHLAEHGFAYFDRAEEVLYVVRGVIHQVGRVLRGNDQGRPDNRAIGLRRELRQIGAHGFVGDFWTRYGETHLLGKWPFEEEPPEWPNQAPSLVARKGRRTLAATPEAPRVAPAPEKPAIELTDDGKVILSALLLYESLEPIANARTARRLVEHRATLAMNTGKVPELAHVVGAIGKLAGEVNGADVGGSPWPPALIGQKLFKFADVADERDLRHAKKKNGNGGPIRQHAERAPGELGNPWDYEDHDPRYLQAAVARYGADSAKGKMYADQHRKARSPDGVDQ